jgi:hypothetical protein
MPLIPTFPTAKPIRRSGGSSPPRRSRPIGAGAGLTARDHQIQHSNDLGRLTLKRPLAFQTDRNSEGSGQRHHPDPPVPRRCLSGGGHQRSCLGPNHHRAGDIPDRVLKALCAVFSGTVASPQRAIVSTWGGRAGGAAPTPTDGSALMQREEPVRDYRPRRP